MQRFYVAADVVEVGVFSPIRRASNHRHFGRVAAALLGIIYRMKSARRQRRLEEAISTTHREMKTRRSSRSKRFLLSQVL